MRQGYLIDCSASLCIPTQATYHLASDAHNLAWQLLLVIVGILLCEPDLGSSV